MSTAFFFLHFRCGEVDFNVGLGLDECEDSLGRADDRETEDTGNGVSDVMLL